MSSNEIVVVFTGKSLEKILNDGGTSSWRLKRGHARQCAYVVCTRNAHSDVDDKPGNESHHSAFLVGKIKDVVPSPTEKGRWLVQFSQYALINIPGVWNGERNPVKYVANEELKALGINLSALKWEPMPNVQEVSKSIGIAATVPLPIRTLTMTEAKNALALTFGVPPEAVEITIHG